MSKSENYPDSMNDTVDTIGPVLQTFINEVVRTEMPNCNYIYDPELSYDTSIQLFRAKNAELGKTEDALPLFSFSRSALKFPENETALHRRTANNVGTFESDNGDHFSYAMVHGEIELQFFYVNKHMREVEQFEINYLANEGISGSREMTVNLPELGDFNYYIQYDDLLDVNINNEGTYYKGLAGTVRIRGFYFVFRSQVQVIKEINCSIYEQNGEIINRDSLLGSKVIS